MIVGERNVRERSVVRVWRLVNGRGWEEKGNGFRIEGLRIVEKREMSRVEG